MDLAIAILLSVMNLALLGTTLLGLPGIWLMLLATGAVAWWRWDQGMFSVWTLGAALALAVVAELLEFAAGLAGTKRLGGSAWGMAGALAGGLVGGLGGTAILPIPVVGTLLGAVIGSGVGAAICEMLSGKDAKFSIRSGTGAGLGRLAGTLIKLALGGLAWLVLTVAAFWP